MELEGDKAKCKNFDACGKIVNNKFGLCADCRKRKCTQCGKLFGFKSASKICGPCTTLKKRKLRYLGE